MGKARLQSLRKPQHSGKGDRDIFKCRIIRLRFSSWGPHAILPLQDSHIGNTEQAQGQGTFDSKRRTEKVFCTEINWKLGCWGEGEGGQGGMEVGEAGGRADRPPAWARTRTRACCEAVKPAWLHPGPLRTTLGSPLENPSIMDNSLLSFLPGSISIAQKCASLMETLCWPLRGCWR